MKRRHFTGYYVYVGVHEVYWHRTIEWAHWRRDMNNNRGMTVIIRPAKGAPE